jgi:acetylornithine deacetylase
MAAATDSTLDAVAAAVDEQRLVDTATSLVAIPSPTGDEQAMAERMREIFTEMGLDIRWQEVEEGRPNVVGTLDGAGGGPTLMFNGHMDTSYSGKESDVAGVGGFLPEPVVRDGRIFGLGISNMKGALSCYVEAVRAIQDTGVRLCGDVMIAAVVGEIEKTAWGEDSGKNFRGYAAGSRYLPSHGGAADMCILGEPTEQKIVLAHYGTMWCRISTRGPFIHTAFSQGRLPENAIVRMRDVFDAVMEWIPGWEERTTYEGMRGVVNVGSIRGGYPWRVSRTPSRCDLFLDVRVPPTMPMAQARREFRDFARELAGRFPDHGVESEVYITAPGAQIDEAHELVQAIDASHTSVFGAAPERDTTRWFSDASALTRYGIQTVNYGTSSGLPTAEGENLDIEGLLQIARVYAQAATRVCGVAA